jgi:large subunit ribosomal protein L35
MAGKVKNKTRKAVSKRFKVTASGKVLRRQQGKRHLLSAKSPKRRRQLRGPQTVVKADMRRITESLPFSR